jgi:hypothetical protein
VSDFVERCRREWDRIGVPVAVADDMAAELAADLEEAAADGVSAADVLGHDASDPRSFAASWAAERGVVPSPRPARKLPGRSGLLVAIAVLLSVAAIAAGAALLVSPTVRSSATPLAQVWRTAAPMVLPRSGIIRIWRGAAVSPDERFAIQVDPAPNPSSDSRHTIAWSLLIAGLVAFVFSSLYRLGAGLQLRRWTS